MANTTNQLALSFVESSFINVGQNTAARHQQAAEAATTDTTGTDCFLWLLLQRWSWRGGPVTPLSQVPQTQGKYPLSTQRPTLLPKSLSPAVSGQSQVLWSLLFNRAPTWPLLPIPAAHFTISPLNCGHRVLQTSTLRACPAPLNRLHHRIRVIFLGCVSDPEPLLKALQGFPSALGRKSNLFPPPTSPQVCPGPASLSPCPLLCPVP